MVILLSLVASLIAQPVHTPTVVIIANPAVQTREISAEDLRSVFLGMKTSLADGDYLKPVLEKAGPAHAAFLKRYLGKTDSALQTYYRSLVFSGKGSMPTTLTSDAAVVAYVQRNRGAIGYVDSGAVDNSVKTIRVR